MRNRFDPFTWPKQFDPGIWPDAPTARAGLYRSIVVHHVRQLNVHGFAHYLRNPRVHVPLLQVLAGEPTIPDDECDKAILEFDNEAVTDMLKNHRDILDNMLPSPSSGWQDLIRVGWAFSQLV